MKLNLSSRPNEIISTLAREWEMASKAFVKYKGGAEKYDKWQDTMLAMANKKEHSFIGDKFLWTSPDGNKWCVFEDVTYDESSTYTHTCHRCFCYYETLPYAGLFLKVDNINRVTGKQEPGAVVYESHFFERLDERKIREWKGIDTLVDFYAKNHSNMVYCTNVDTRQHDVRLDNCIGRGFASKDCPTLYYIKTVLSDEQLTTRQRKDTALGRRTGDSTNKYIDLPPESVSERNMGRVAKSLHDGNYEEVITEMKRDFARMHNIPYEEADKIFQYNLYVSGILQIAKPSLFATIDVDKNTAVLQLSIDIKEEYERRDLDDEGFKKLCIDKILEFCKQFKLNITRQTILKSMFKLKSLR